MQNDSELSIGNSNTKMNEEDRAKPSTLRRLASHVTQDIDTSKAFVPLTLMCVITGCKRRFSSCFWFLEGLC